MASKYTQQAFSRINLFDSLRLFKVHCFSRHASLETPHESCFCKYLCDSTFWCYRTRMRFEHVDCNLEETASRIKSVLASHLKMLHYLFARCNFCSTLHAPLCGVMDQGLPTWTPGMALFLRTDHKEIQVRTRCCHIEYHLIKLVKSKGCCQYSHLLKNCMSCPSRGWWASSMWIFVAV
jgi:hypothetical protein